MNPVLSGKYFWNYIKYVTVEFTQIQLFVPIQHLSQDSHCKFIFWYFVLIMRHFRKLLL